MAVKQFGVPLDAVAIEYSEARKLLDGVPLIDGGALLRPASRGVESNASR
jgi:hypothetical protein